MQSGTEKTIEILKIYKCGYCVNNLSDMFKNTQTEKRKFPASSILIRHKTHGLILFDTGYGKRVNENGIISKVYNFFNPLVCSKEDEVINQLKADGICAQDINYVILSHLHPDHIGGLLDLPYSKIICSKQVLEKIKKHSFRDLIYNNLLPKDILERAEVISEKKRKHYDPISKLFENTFDLFEDGSLFIVELGGHAIGQIGMYIASENTFFVADACWGVDLIEKDMKTITRLIQNDYRRYCLTTKALKNLMEEYPNMKIIPTHGE